MPRNIAIAKSHVLQAPSMFFWRVLSSCGSAECRGVEETGARPAVKCCIQLKWRRIENWPRAVDHVALMFGAVLGTNLFKQ